MMMMMMMMINIYCILFDIYVRKILMSTNKRWQLTGFGKCTTFFNAFTNEWVRENQFSFSSSKQQLIKMQMKITCSTDN